MQTCHTQNRHPLFSSFFILCAIQAVLLFQPLTALAQEDQTPKRGFTTAGSYALGEIETINTTGGNLMLNIPLVSLPAGRAGLTHGLRLNYNSKLYDHYTAVGTDPYTSDPVDQNLLTFSGEGGWRYSFGYSLQITDRSIQYPSTGMPVCPAAEARYLYKVKMRFPDGSLHEFRPSGYSNYQLGDWYEIRPDGLLETCGSPSWVTSTLNYYSTDGTYMRLEVEHDYDGIPTNNPWTLYLPDGGMITGGDAPNRIYDRNGNYIELQHDADYNGSGNPADLIVDQLGRALVIEYDSTAGEDYIRVQGFNNQTLTWTVKWGDIWFYKKYQAADSSPYYISPWIEEIWNYLPVVEEITLPSQAGSGLKYEFGYNSNASWPNQSYGWGEVSSVTLPEGVRSSGATASYEYRQDGYNSPGTYLISQDVLNNSPVQKELAYWLEYDGGASQTADTWAYSINPQDGWSTITQPDGGVIREDFGNPFPSYSTASLVYKTTQPDGSIIERIWDQNRPYGTSSSYSEVNAFVKTEFVSIKDAGGTLVKTAIKDYSHDKNGNVTQVDEYDWVAYGDVPRSSGRPTGIPGGATLKRRTVNTYYNPTPDASNTGTDDGDVYHKTSSPNIKRALESSETGTSSTVLSRTESFYDNASTTGNLTSQKSWDSTKGSISYPLGSGNSITVSHTYDGYGNRTLTTDPEGVQTFYDYDEIDGMGSETDLYPTDIKTAYTSGVERHTKITYDFSSGTAKTSKDVNNNVTAKTTYDIFARPTLVEEADGTGVERQAATQYNDLERRVVIKSDLDAAGDGKIVTVQHFDQLGRIRLSRQLENYTDDVEDEEVGIKVQTRYFAGSSGYPNVYQLVSNPYRAATSSAASSEETMGWSRTKLDIAGRLVEAKTFNATLPQPWGSGTGSTGAVVTEYDAEYTKVTDQASKLRRSRVDGLGRLVRVDEPDGGGSLGTTSSPNQATSYTYDALNNLTEVSQGAQTRTFVYSSLSRLTSAANPESGTVTYAYDDNGNLTGKTDARSATTTITYDSLNRPVSKSYSGITTPTVNYYYDNQSLPSGAPSYSRGFALGRLVAVTYDGGSEGNYFGYDELGRPTVKYQRVSTTNYQISASYNRAGAMTGETYPSSRTVSYSYDTVARLSTFTGTLGDGTSRTYATVTQYNAAGQKERESYGTGTHGMSAPLYLKLHYNRRHQMVDLRLGSSSSEWDYDRGALIFYYGSGGVTNWNPFQDDTDNNGNVLRQVNYVPKTGGGDVIPQLDDYTYDSLNRISGMTEWQYDASGNWQSNVVTQSFTYDRYGNRCVSSATGGVSNSCPTYTSSTNRISSGLTYDASGNITYDAATGGTMAYDAENRMVTASSGGTYTYDGEGKRVKRVAGGQTWWYVYGFGGELLAEYLSGAPTTVKKEYGYRGGQLLLVWDGDKSGDEQWKWLVQDHLGSTRMEADKSGSLSAMKRHDYAPFGEEMYAGIRQSSGVGQYGYEPPQTNVRQKFTGYERDNESELDFAQARYMSSVQGRFTSADPLYFTANRLIDPQQFNLYAYVRNNPLILIDPTGMDAVAYSGAIGNDLTEEDRKRLQAGLSKLAPGTKVDANGVVHKPGFFRRVLNNLTGHGAGTSLLSQIVDSSKTTSIVIGDFGDLSNRTGVTDSSRRSDSTNGVGADTTIFWNPNSPDAVEVASGNGSIVSQRLAGATGAAAFFGHEFIHALDNANGTNLPNYILGPGGTIQGGRPLDIEHQFMERGVRHSELISQGEYRAVGFSPQPGRFTEQQIRRELGLAPRAAYMARRDWAY